MPLGTRTTAAIATAAVTAAHVGARLALSRVDYATVWHTELADRKYWQMRRLAVTGGVDVVIAGCSSAVYGIDARRVGEELPSVGRVYNASLYRGMPGLQQHWVPDVVLPLLRPRVLVYCYTGFHLNDNGVMHAEIENRYLASRGARQRRPVHWGLELLRNSTVEVVAREVAKGRARWIASRAHSGLRSLLAGDFRFAERAGVVGPWGLGTERERFSYRPSEKVRVVVADEMGANLALGGRQSDALRATIAAANRAGTMVVLAHMPVTAEAIACYPNGAEDDRRAVDAVGRIARELGVAEVDVAPGNDDPTLFAELMHMNALGREHCSRRLGEELQRLLS